MNDGIKNLKPVQTKEEARKRGANGGRKSGVARREKKKMRELMNTLMDLPVSDNNKAVMERLGITDPEEQTNKMLVAIGLMKRATSGDPRAVGMLVGICGDFLEEQESSIPETLEIKFIDASQKDKDESDS